MIRYLLHLLYTVFICRIPYYLPYANRYIQGLDRSTCLYDGDYSCTFAVHVAEINAVCTVSILCMVTCAVNALGECLFQLCVYCTIVLRPDLVTENLHPRPTSPS